MVRYSPSPKYLEIPTLLAKPCPPWWPLKQWSVLQQLKRGTSESPGTSTLLRKATGDIFELHLSSVRLEHNTRLANAIIFFLPPGHLKKNLLDTAWPVAVSMWTYLTCISWFPGALGYEATKKGQGSQHKANQDASDQLIPESGISTSKLFTKQNNHIEESQSWLSLLLSEGKVPKYLHL